MKFLNEAYYRKLLDKFGDSQNLLSKCEGDNFISINASFLEKALTEPKKNLIVKVPDTLPYLINLYANLFLRLTELQCLEVKENPDFSIGMKFKRTKGKKDLTLELVDIRSNEYKLEEIPKGKKRVDSPAIFTVPYKKLKNNYVPISKGTRRSRLDGVKELFQLFYKEDLIPDQFHSKSIVICGKKLWKEITSQRVSSLKSGKKLKEMIPMKYLTKEGKEISNINIDPLMYVVPDYRTAYEQVIRHNENINNIFLIEPKEKLLSQLINDQNRFKFGVCAISTKDVTVSGLNKWRWLKEEIDMIKKL